jgi:hypothetical protein
MYVVDLNPGSPNYGALVAPPAVPLTATPSTKSNSDGKTLGATASPIADWAYDTAHNTLVGVFHTSSTTAPKLAIYNPTNGNVTTITISGDAAVKGSVGETADSWGAVFFDATGNIYAYANIALPGSGVLYKIDPTTGASVEIAEMPIGNQGIDGATCPTATISSKSLPVTGLQLSAQSQGNAVQLSWSTTTEINSSSFTVQRSADNGKTWITVGSQPTKATNGNSSIPLAYAMTDYVTQSDIYQYRVVEADVDGFTTMSNTIQVTVSTTGATVFPNPAKSVINVIEPADVTDVAYKLISADGKIALKGVTTANGIAQISVASVASGIYFLQVTANNVVQTYEVQILQ